MIYFQSVSSSQNVSSLVLLLSSFLVVVLGFTVGSDRNLARFIAEEMMWISVLLIWYGKMRKILKMAVQMYIWFDFGM